MHKFQIRLIADNEIKELIAVAHNIAEIQVLLKSNYVLTDYRAITIRTQSSVDL